MNKLNAFGNAQFLCAQFGLRSKERAHVDASAGNPVVTCPGAKHLSRAAAEIENARVWLHA